MPTVTQEQFDRAKARCKVLKNMLGILSSIELNACDDLDIKDVFIGDSLGLLMACIEITAQGTDCELDPKEGVEIINECYGIIETRLKLSVLKN